MQNNTDEAKQINLGRWVFQRDTFMGQLFFTQQKGWNLAGKLKFHDSSMTYNLNNVKIQNQLGLGALSFNMDNQYFKAMIRARTLRFYLENLEAEKTAEVWTLAMIHPAHKIMNGTSKWSGFNYPFSAYKM